MCVSAFMCVCICAYVCVSVFMCVCVCVCGDMEVPVNVSCVSCSSFCGGDLSCCLCMDGERW